MSKCIYCGTTKNVDRYWCGNTLMCDDCAEHKTRNWECVLHCSICNTQRCRFVGNKITEEDELGW